MRRAGRLSNRQGMIPTERFSLIGNNTDFCVSKPSSCPAAKHLQLRFPRHDRCLLVPPRNDGCRSNSALDVLVAVAEPVEPHFLWRPRLGDPDDDMVLEAAVNGRAEAVVTFNARDFAGVVEEFGIELLTPVAILRRM